MPPIPDQALTPQQRAAQAELVSGPRGALAGPFVPLLRSPGLMERAQKLGAYLRFESALPDRIKELAILAVAAHWGQGYEWAFHLPLALKAGVARETAQALAEGRAPEQLTAEDAAALDLVGELQADRTVSEPTYRQAVALFGEAGAVDLAGFAGYYGLLAMVMNMARTPAEEAEIPLRTVEARR